MIGMGILSDFCRKHKLTYNVALIIVFAVLAFLSSFFLFRTHSFYGACDLNFHIKRILTLEEFLRHGHSLVSSISFDYFHGSMATWLYPNLNILPIVIGHLFIKSNITLIYLFIDFTVFLSFICSYYGSFYLNYSRWVSLGFSVIYSLGFPFFYESFFNVDLGSLTAMAFMPLAIFGLINLLENGNSLELIIGITMITYSHILNAVIFLLFVLLIIGINTNLIRKRKLWPPIVYSFIDIILLTSIVWLPIIYLAIFNFDEIYPPTLEPLQGTGVFTLLSKSVIGYETPYLSVFAIIGLIISIFFYKQFDRYEMQFYWISLGLVIICSRFFPWGITNHGLFKLFKVFQFTWRFYIIPEILLSYLVSICIFKLIESRKIKIIFGIFIILFTGITGYLGQKQYINNNYPEITNKFLTKKNSKINVNVPIIHKRITVKDINWSLVGNDHDLSTHPVYKVSNNHDMNRLANAFLVFNAEDYWPVKAVPRMNYINNNEATYGHNRTINVEHTGYNQFSFNSPKRINRLALPLLHYNGEHLRVYVNHHLVHSHANGNSLVTLDNVKKGRSVVGVRNVLNVWIVVMKSVLFVIGMVWILFFVNKIVNYKRLKNLYNNWLKEKYFCVEISLVCSIFLIILLLIFNRPFTNIKIIFIDISVMLIPYCMILDIIIHIERANEVSISNDIIMKYLNKFRRNFIIKYHKMTASKFNILMLSFVFICSSVYEIFVLSMVKMSHIIVDLNRINKNVTNTNLSHIDDAYALYFMSWMILGMAFLFILSIMYYNKIDKGFMNLCPTVIVSNISIIGVMLTALSTVQRGAYTQSISYNFSIMFVYLMTPICIILIDLIHIYKMRYQYKVKIYHLHISDLLKSNKEMYNSQYHFTK